MFSLTEKTTTLRKHMIKNMYRHIKIFKNRSSRFNSLVKQVVVHLDLRIGLEVIRHQHDGDLNVTQLIYLEHKKKGNR